MSVFQPPQGGSNQQFTAIGTAFAAFPDNLLCKNRGAESLPILLNGRLNSDTRTFFDLVVLLPAQGAFRPTGTVNGDSITLTGPSDNGGSITINLSRFDTQLPTQNRTSESYTGTYSITGNFGYRCSDNTQVNASGTAVLSVFDQGRGVNGAFRLSNFPSVGFATPTSGGACGVRIIDPANVELTGTLTAGTDNTFTGFLQIPDFVPVRGTFSLSTFQGVADVPGGGQLILNLTNTNPLKAPIIEQFQAKDPLLARGEPTRLLWRTAYADKVTIDNGIGVQPAVGAIQVRPGQTTVYTISATTQGGTATQSTTIDVRDLPVVVVGDFPDGFIELTNQGGGTDSFTLANNGAATTVTLTTNANFVTLSPTQFGLAPSETKKITITGLPEPAGAYRGAVNITATGGGSVVSQIAVNMLVVDSVAGAVKPEVKSRFEVTSLVGQNATIAVPFTNRGNTPIIGIATSKARFINPQNGLITIPAGATVPVQYDIDVSLRPLDIPLGAVTSRIGLLLPALPNQPTALVDRATSTSATTTLTHVVTPAVGPGIPPPLLPGEVAFIVAGLGNKTANIGDLLLANSASTPLQQFALFINGNGGLATSAALPTIGANTNIELPGLIKNVIGASVPTGTAQLRGSDATRATISAVAANTSLPEGTYSTSLPVLRSDRTAGSLEKIILSGVQKSGIAQTNLFVQEMSGLQGAFSIDYLDATGRVISSLPSQSLDGFGLAEIDDAVPPNAIAARITNTSIAGRLEAFALVTNPSTNDGWVVTDPSTGSTDQSVIIPIFTAGNNAITTLYTTNRTNGRIDVTVEQPQFPHRHAARVSSVGSPRTASDDVPLGALETKAVPIGNNSGFIRVTAPAGSISTAARSVVVAGSQAFGSGLPAIPVSQSLHAGDTRRFGNIDDASAKARNNQTPATFRNSVTLVETAGQPATVRLTLTYTVTSGSKTTSSAVTFKDYPVAAGGFVTIADLGTELIGANRATLGDIRDATLDFEVTGGSGAIIPFLASVDNGSGDLIVRTE